MNITNYILSKTSRLVKQPEVSPGDHGFEMFNDAGTEVEVSEFLYSIVRIMKPDFILETGTHIGVSATYMGLALQHNNRGSLSTFEVIPQHYNNARKLWDDVGVGSYITSYLQDAQRFDASGTSIDILFLDSEPHLRFDEFLKFWPQVRPGGLIIVHDLHPSMGHHGQIMHGKYDWPYGDFREKLGPYMKDYSIQTISFPTPRGLTMFQKASDSFSFTQYLLGKLND